MNKKQSVERQAVMDAVFEMLLANHELLPSVDLIRRDNDNVRINIMLDDGGCVWTIDCTIMQRSYDIREDESGATGTMRSDWGERGEADEES
jgi:uncharacterized lipoprotein